MAVDINFLNKRVEQLEGLLQVVILKLEGVVSEAAIQQLMALRQQEIIDMENRLLALESMVKNWIGQP